MPAGTLSLTGNLRIEQGATYDVTLTLYDTYIAAGNAGNVLRNLTSHTARMQIRRTTGTAAPEIELLSSTAGAVPGTVAKLVMGGAAGTIRVFIPATMTDDLNGWTEGVWQLEIERTSDGYVWRELQGDVALDLEVVR